MTHHYMIIVTHLLHLSTSVNPYRVFSALPNELFQCRQTGTHFTDHLEGSQQLGETVIMAISFDTSLISQCTGNINFGIRWNW